VISDRTATIIIAVVTVIWAANIIAGMVRLNDYQPSESVNAIFMAVVGGAFALRGKGHGGDGDHKR
jgi:ABC-type branched-subunit amino acid transport system permease subunit